MNTDTMRLNWLENREGTLLHHKGKWNCNATSDDDLRAAIDGAIAAAEPQQPPSLDWGAALQTRDGRPAELLCVLKRRGMYTHVMKVVDKDGEETTGHYCADGHFTATQINTEHDIINVPLPPPVTLEAWANVYPMPTEKSTIYSPFSVYLTKEKADDLALEHRVACVPVLITYRDGEGL